MPVPATPHERHRWKCLHSCHSSQSHSTALPHCECTNELYFAPPRTTHGTWCGWAAPFRHHRYPCQSYTQRPFHSGLAVYACSLQSDLRLTSWHATYWHSNLQYVHIIRSFSFSPLVTRKTTATWRHYLLNSYPHLYCYHHSKNHHGHRCLTISAAAATSWGVHRCPTGSLSSHSLIL